ncbi:helix-turn-helix domain-containing protein [Clostridium sp. ZBS15]|uniref:helix-turn-helix domain-containing protein n=1 Tax=Clostridium sp. ZBS15 TaxID=2949969 RepID=UPI0020793CD2
MDYMSASEAAIKWGISKRRVQVLCSENRVNGAKKVGIMWVIPKEAEKPLDKRVVNNN